MIWWLCTVLRSLVVVGTCRVHFTLHCYDTNGDTGKHDGELDNGDVPYATQCSSYHTYLRMRVPLLLSITLSSNTRRSTSEQCCTVPTASWAMSMRNASSSSYSRRKSCHRTNSMDSFAAASRISAVILLVVLLSDSISAAGKAPEDCLLSKFSFSIVTKLICWHVCSIIEAWTIWLWSAILLQTGLQVPQNGNPYQYCHHWGITNTRLKFETVASFTRISCVIMGCLGQRCLFGGQLRLLAAAVVCFYNHSCLHDCACNIAPPRPVLDSLASCLGSI